VGLLTAQFLEFDDKASVLVFDTEQSKFHAQKAIKRIHRLLEWEETKNNKRLRVFRLRELTTDQRLEFVKSAIEYYRPDLVFLDGVRDTIHDFNSIAESSEVINLLMKLSSETNSHICCILHENKSDNNLRGHAGTELQNKSETVISVDRTDDFTSEVTPKFCRNIAFEKFYFKISENGLPEYCEPEVKPKNTDKLKMIFEDILPKDITYNYAELRSKVMEKCDIKERSAEYKIKQALEQSIITKNSAGLYYSTDLNNVNATENELPF